jgi:hypothetical protein
MARSEHLGNQGLWVFSLPSWVKGRKGLAWQDSCFPHTLGGRARSLTSLSRQGLALRVLEQPGAPGCEPKATYPLPAES